MRRRATGIVPAGKGDYQDRIVQFRDSFNRQGVHGLPLEALTP